MAKYRVYLETGASLSVTVEVDDNLPENEVHDAAIEAAFESAPRGVCAQCSGWGEKWGLDLGEWEVETDADGKEIPPERQ